jgi:hypothetical protein
VNRTRLARFGILLVGWLMATGSGPCAFFKPAEPEPPTNLNPIIPDYSTPTLALQTLAEGVMDKNQRNGHAVYMGAFADSSGLSVGGGDGRAFYAFFDPKDLQSHSTTWDRNAAWDKPHEDGFYGKLVTLFSYNYVMTWEPYEPSGNETGSNTDSLLHRKYTITYQASNGPNSFTSRTIAIGAADLYFVKSANVANRWAMTRWQDFHTVDADSGQVTIGSRRLDQ